MLISPYSSQSKFCFSSSQPLICTHNHQFFSKYFWKILSHTHKEYGILSGAPGALIKGQQTVFLIWRLRPKFGGCAIQQASTTKISLQHDWIGPHPFSQHAGEPDRHILWSQPIFGNPVEHSWRLLSILDMKSPQSRICFFSQASIHWLWR